ncbi:hydroxyethylthiazole kinase [Desulfonatronospira sp.]|uniref:hydroxyethylthiazole kinase n=2 Tax=Desulfonatronospira sp. TaxID=1962951 RepID=UPI0025BBA41D|nr:hydroxyethylthiazole kinase [Desulfonatronospira sp.]
MITSEKVWERLEEIREKRPLVLNLTNIVVTNITANALLALGASPAMTRSEHEVEELTSLGSALVLNMGTPCMNQVQAMRLAASRAVKLGVPVVLDPVGAGASKLRVDSPMEFLKKGWVSILRGNASEIMALGGSGDKPRGVDSLHGSSLALEAARALSRRYECVVCVSGEKDLVVSGDKALAVNNGHPMMTRVTGMGCCSTCLTAAFSAVEKDFFQAAAMGMAVMGLAGERAALEARGPGSLQTRFLDELYVINKEMLEGIHLETEV